MSHLSSDDMVDYLYYAYWLSPVEAISRNVNRHVDVILFPAASFIPNRVWGCCRVAAVERESMHLLTQLTRPVASRSS